MLDSVVGDAALMTVPPGGIRREENSVPTLLDDTCECMFDAVRALELHGQGCDPELRPGGLSELPLPQRVRRPWIENDGHALYRRGDLPQHLQPLRGKVRAGVRRTCDAPGWQC